MTTTGTPWAEDLSSGRGFIGEPTIESTRRLLADYFRQPRWAPEKRSELADWARAHFDWKTLAPRYADFYRDVLATSARGPAARQSSLS
jgi:glycosyltransferase involved in cell wall biosynthesis